MSSRPLYVLGADGGGTKTLGVLADLEGKEIAQCKVGAGNPNVVGIETASTNLLDVVTGCCEQAGVDRNQIGAMVFGLAGVGSAKVNSRLTGAVRAGMTARGWTHIPFAIETDARIALEGAFRGEPGVVIIAGTGSALMGKFPDGTALLVGGWGRLLGDEGSGFGIGWEALRLVSRDIDRRADAKALRSLFAERVGWVNRDAIIAAVYQEKFDLATLAPFVIEAAEKGDPTALRILREGAAHLVDQLAVLAARLESQPAIGVVFIGGLIDRGTVYTQIVTETIAARIPKAVIRQAQLPPAHGAVLMALNNLQRA